MLNIILQKPLLKITNARHLATYRKKKVLLDLFAAFDTIIDHTTLLDIHVALYRMSCSTMAYNIHLI